MAYLMMVDDDEDYASIVATALRDAGHETRIEREPTRAMASMEDRRPDLVILDVMFPQNTSGGFELARAMRQDKGKLSEIPILMLTSVNQKFPVGLGSGDIDDDWLPVGDFLDKPVDLNVLRDKVSALLHDAGSADSNTRSKCVG